MEVDVSMSKTYGDVIEHIDALLSSVETELKGSDNSQQDLYYIYFKIAGGIRRLDAMLHSLIQETDSFPLLNELSRCQDLIHRIQSNHSMVDEDPEFMNRFVRTVTRLCDSIFTAYKMVYENGLVRDFI